MQRERVSDDIFVFTSDRYAQVTASVVLTGDGAVLIDTMAFPAETREIKHYVETRLHMPIRTVIYTHYHADHTYGAFLFPDALIVGHAATAELLDTKGREALARVKKNSAEFAEVEVVLPNYTFSTDSLELKIGARNFQLWRTPGHSMDAIVCMLKEDRVLFAGDTLMPIPYFVDGDYATLVQTLEGLRGCNFENVIEGHGEMILKGEVEDKIASDLDYMAAIKAAVVKAQTRPDPEAYLAKIDVEQCGKSRVLINGAVQDLHQANLRVLYRQMQAAQR